MKIKILVTLIMMVLVASISQVSVFASHYTYGPSSFNEDFSTRLNVDAFRTNRLNDRALLDRNIFARNENLFDQDMSAVMRLLNDRRVENLRNDRDVLFNDGFNFNKEPCSTRFVKVDYNGKNNDVKISEQSCDGISGNFFKNNRVADVTRRESMVDTRNVDANAVLRNVIRNLDSREERDSASRTADTERFDRIAVDSSFGRGVRVVFN